MFHSILLIFVVLKIGTCISSSIPTKDLISILTQLNEISQPFQVVALLCLRRDEIVSIYKELTFPMQYIPIEDESVLDTYNESWKESAHYLMFLVDLQCNNATEILENAKMAKFFRHPFRWLMLGESFNQLPTIEALSDSNILFFDGIHQIWSIYKIRPSSPYIFDYFGNWNGTNLNINQTAMILSRHRRNLQGNTLKASVVLTQNQSVSHLEDYQEKHIDSIGKKDFAITKSLVAALNATLDYNIVETWGYYDSKTEKWSGMIGELTNGESDIGGTSLFFQPSRVKIIEYISMVTPTRAAFVFREPPLSSTSNIYLLPFASLVWITSGGMVILAVLLVFLMAKVQKVSIGLEENPKSFTRFTDAVLVGISAISQMGLILQPKSLSSRITSIFILIALLFLYTSYTANIVALLQSTAKTITTLKDLLNSNLEMGLDDTVYNRYYFSVTTEPIRKKLYETKLLTAKRGTFLNTSTGIDLLRGGSFAFHVELSVGYELIEKIFYEHEKCNLKNIYFIQVIDPWYSIRKNSSFKEILKVNLFKIREHGIQAREHAKIYTKQPTCTAHGQNFGSVGLQECYWPFMILFSGFGISFVIFFVEKVWLNAKICLY